MGVVLAHTRQRREQRLLNRIILILAIRVAIIVVILGLLVRRSTPQGV